MRLAVFLLLFTASLAPGESARAQERPRPAAEQNFQWYCIQCHGPRGDGKGVNNTAKLPVSPRNLTDGRDMAQFSDEDMTRTITRGGGASDLSPIMPPWGHTLAAEEIRDLVAHVRKLCRCRFDPKAKDRFLREQGKQPPQSLDMEGAKP
ncbi:MAG: cytochrome c [Candidatus Tectomicrobia bacterium]|uniref:Cytochrome c n=1 Tax=Tectimicrobiota bacterium TaxID=2528274 RepID=A0A932HYR7_UNCTE|nr:cytochrome c [Candidatus Tectomicrobia bacterium]